MKRAHDKRRLMLHFTRHREDRSAPYSPFEQPFSDFSKAVICIRAGQRGVGYKYQKQMLLALRCLYEALFRSDTADPSELKPHHFQSAAIAACDAFAHTTAYAIGVLLEELSDFIDFHQITPVRIGFRNPVSYPPKGDGLDEESQARGMDKMPTPAALEALALASSNPLDDDERILLRVLDLFVIGNFRAGEALTLPLDCWVEEAAFGQDGKPKFDPESGGVVKRCGLRYWPEKGGEPIVKWLPDCSVPLAKRAVEDLTRLCADARQTAARLEQNPDRVPLSGSLHPDDLLDRHQLIAALGLSNWGSVRSFLGGTIYVQPVQRERDNGRGGNRNLYRVADIESALVSRRARLEVVTKPSGKKQKLSESLCVMFRNQFDSKRATLYFLPELIGYRQVTTALGNAPGASSIFSRRSLTEPDGSPMKIRTHAFRHWLNTLADRGGLSDLELALWSGRKDIRQNAAYKHGTVAQRAEWVRKMIQAGKLHGDVADTYSAINDSVEKERFLETFVGVAHFTPFGVCVHEFALDPCPYHLNCLDGCPEYLRTKGDEEEQHHIRELRVFTARQLELAEQAMSEDEYGSSNWVDCHRRILKGADAALAVDDDHSTQEGERVPVFPTGTPVGQPLEGVKYEEEKQRPLRKKTTPRRDLDHNRRN
jgi:hypothetical protein